jgi:anti-anti-sigma regulatory factor
MKKLGGDVRLVGVSGLVADVVRVVKLDKILQIYDTVEEAVEDIEGAN